MREFLRDARDVGIVLFVLVHAAAIALYAIPIDVQPSLPSVVRWAQETTAPYVLLTSQWQQWNLFSPDPIRTVSTYTIEQQVGETWSTVHTLQRGSVAWLRHALFFKLLGEVLGPPGTKMSEMLMVHFCDVVEPGGRMRVRADSYILPGDRSLSVAEWQQWSPAIVSHWFDPMTCSVP